MLIENGQVISQAPLTISGRGGFGSRVCSLQNSSAGAFEWLDISRNDGQGARLHDETGLLDRMRTTPGFSAVMQKRLHPGSVLVLTDAPLHPDSRSGRDFVIMS